MNGTAETRCQSQANANSAPFFYIYQVVWVDALGNGFSSPRFALVVVSLHIQHSFRAAYALRAPGWTAPPVLRATGGGSTTTADGSTATAAAPLRRNDLEPRAWADVVLAALTMPI